MIWSSNFWPIAENKKWTFQSTTAKAAGGANAITEMLTDSIMPDGCFRLTIAKDAKETYWGPEERWEDCLLDCKMDEHGIYMLSYRVFDWEQHKTTKQFQHFCLEFGNDYYAENHFEATPWLHKQGWPVYPFIPEGAFSMPLGQWHFMEHLVLNPPNKVLHNSWETKVAVENLFIPMFNIETQVLRVDYLETNTPCHRDGDYNVIDLQMGWDLDEQPTGPMIHGNYVRPIRVNETWWFAWGVGPVKVRHEHNKWDHIKQEWSGPCDTYWKYGPVHEIELISAK